MLLVEAVRTSPTTPRMARLVPPPSALAVPSGAPRSAPAPGQLYTPEQRRRRDASRWTIVQAVLAPLQFVAFAVSAVLVVRFLATDQGLVIANGSVVVKTLFLYAIMVTGALWERDVFGQYLFAPAFYWEDMVSMVVIALHTAYLAALATAALAPRALMALALAAYATYAVNATQFVLKLRAARLAARDAARDAVASEAAAPETNVLAGAVPA